MKFRAHVISVSLALAFAANAHAITPAYEFTGSTIASDPSPYSLGFEFSLSGTTSIYALAYFNDGTRSDHQVGLWDTAGQLLASTTVHSTDTLNGHFNYAAITTLTLSAGNYVIAGTYLGNAAPAPVYLTGVTTAAGYSWVRDLQLSGTGLAFPTQNIGNYGQNGIAVVNFSVTAVPEPETYAMLIAGLALTGVAVRRRKSQP